MTRPRQTITVVPVERLTAHPDNIRDGLGDLTELALSIREHGILQPLTATEHPTNPDLLRLLAGHRRLGAALLAGETKVPVIIRHSHYLTLLELDDAERVEIRQGNFTATDALTLVRAQRDQKRKRVGGGPVGRPKGRTTTPYFSDQHPLAKTVMAACDHRGRPKVGKVGCGPCWEQAIREDAAAAVSQDVAS